MNNEVLEGNKAIRLFMIKGTVSDEEYKMRSIKHLKHFSDLQYHTSWDWLMPVVQKIETIYLKENPESPLLETLMKMPVTSNISEVWAKTVQFITFYKPNPRP